MKSFFLIILALVSQPALAQLDSEQALDFYRIEIIVFRHANGDDPAYLWPGQPDTGVAMDLFAPDQASGSMLDLYDIDEPRQAVYGDAAANLDVLHDQSTPGPVLVVIEPPSPIQALPDEELMLTDAWRRLDRNRGYQPLLHLGWRQPASPFGEALPIRIHGGAIVVQAPAVTPFFKYPSDDDADSGSQSVEELDGVVAFERGRFLHLRIDLALHVPHDDQSFSTQAATPVLDTTIAAPFDEPYRTYRLQEKRQIRTGTLNYFDHRRFGMISLVEKWEPAVEEPGIENSDSLDPPL